MAIKGKGKPKQGRRAVARGPRPGYVEPPKPLFQRTWFRVSALVFLVLAAAAIIVSLVLIKQSNDRKDKAAELAHEKQGRVQQYAGPVIQYLQGVAQPLGGGTQVAAFPNLAQNLADLKSGTLKPEDAIAEAKNKANNARVAAQNLDRLNATKIVSGFPDLLDLLDSKTELKNSLLLYRQLYVQMRLAAETSDKVQRDALIDSAQATIPAANELFTDGYQKLVNAQIAVNLPPNVFPVPQPTPTPTAAPPTTAPPTTAPTSPEPSPSSSASPEPTKSAGGGNGGGNGGNGNGGGGGGKKGTPKASASAG